MSTQEKNKIRFKDTSAIKGIGEVRLRDAQRTGTVTVRDYTDERGDLVKLLNSSGNPVVVKINKNRRLDLSNPDEKLLFEHIANHPVYTKTANPILECINLEEKALDIVQQKSLLADAIIVVRGLKGSELRNFAKIVLFGNKVTFNDNTSDNVLLEHIYELAETKPELILAEWNSPEKEYKILLNNGLSVGVFKHANNIYKYKDSIMGTTFEQAISFLKDNEDMLPNIRKEIKE